MLNSTFNPARTSDFDKGSLAINWQSVRGTCAAGTTTSFDYTLTDDMLLTGLHLLAKGSTFGDTITLQIVCITGTLANGQTICPPNTVLNQFGTNIGVGDDYEEKVNIDADFPAKLAGGLTVRSQYTSTSTTVPVNVIVNLKLITLLK